MGAGNRIHRIDVRVRFGELDAYGHVNHAAYLPLFEHGRVEMLDLAGASLGALHGGGHLLVVAELTTRYVRAASLGDELTIETWIGRLARTTCVFEQRALRDGDTVARQSTKGAFCDLDLRPRRIPAEIADRLRPWVDVKP